MKLKKGKENLLANISLIFFILNIIIRIICFVLMVKYKVINMGQFCSSVVIYAHIPTIISFILAFASIIIANIKQNKKCIIKSLVILILDLILTFVRIFYTYESEKIYPA